MGFFLRVLRSCELLLLQFDVGSATAKVDKQYLLTSILVYKQKGREFVF